MALSLVSIVCWGLNLGIDFTGGSLLEVEFFEARPSTGAINEALEEFQLGEVKVQPAGEAGLILRFRNVSEQTHQKIVVKLQEFFGSEDSSQAILEEKRFESVGPVIGREIKKKAWLAIILAVVMIIAYIAYAFRKISKPVSSWKYGVAAILALIHDIVVILGLFSVLGYFFGTEIDSLFITALLTILGFSVHDTIVVFDRTRENLARHYQDDFEQVVNDSVNQTITRSINTSVTTLLVLVTLFLFGGRTISDFVLALIAGVVVGTYSSIFVASPILVSWQKTFRKVKF